MKLASDRGKIALALGYQNEGPDMDLKKGLYVLPKWNMAKVGSRFGASYGLSRQSRKMAFFTNAFEPLPHVLFYIFVKM